MQARDLKRELEEREGATGAKRRRADAGTAVSDEEDSADAPLAFPADLDADDSDDDDAASDDSSDDSSDDDEAEIRRELERIKAERAEAKAKAEAEAKEREELDRQKAVLMGNPLLAPSGAESASFAAKRRWDDDVIFKNQSAGEGDVNSKDTFVNDTLRNAFHRKFMNKYMR